MLVHGTTSANAGHLVTSDRPAFLEKAGGAIKIAGLLINRKNIQSLKYFEDSVAYGTHKGYISTYGNSL
jgi:hypothetical protein